MDEGIRLFAICSGMRWAHLPLAGGLYDQDPRLLDKWDHLFALQAQQQKDKTAPTPTPKNA